MSNFIKSYDKYKSGLIVRVYKDFTFLIVPEGLRHLNEGFKFSLHYNTHAGFKKANWLNNQPLKKDVKPIIEVKVKPIKRGVKKGFKVPLDFIPPLRLNGFQLKGLYGLITKYGVDYKTLDYMALCDPTLNYHENKALLEEELIKISSCQNESKFNNEIEKYQHQYKEYLEQEGV